ncbi:MAG TPA: DUF177 domain-containing protein [Polyangiaceae bacterium]|jgi:uncharacterized protein
MAARPSFVVQASELDAGGKDFQRTIPQAWLAAVLEETDAKPLGDGEIDLRLSKSGPDVVVHGTAKADVELPCSRCLEPARVTLEPKISVLMVPAAKVREPEREHEMGAGEADVLPYDGDSVVLDDLVRDDLLLEIPMIPLCSEGCTGISSVPESAGRKGIDPRLAPLLAFKKENKE